MYQKIILLLFEDDTYHLIIEINVILSRGYCSFDENLPLPLFEKKRGIMDLLLLNFL